MTTENLPSEDSFCQALLQSITEYVIAINRNYQVIMANDRAKNEFGIQTKAPCYRTWKKRDKKCENCLVEASFRDGQVHRNEEVFVMKDGRRAQLLVRSTPVRNDQGKIAYVLETATDISEKKRLQNEIQKTAKNLDMTIGSRLRHLQKSEEKYRTIFERSRDAIILTNGRGKIKEINKAGIDLLGYRTKEALLGLEWTEKIFKSKEDVYRFQKLLANKGFVTEFEARLTGKRSRTFVALITSNVILDAGGHITGCVIIIRDITKRKEAQKRIESNNARLSILNHISMTVGSSLDLSEVLQQSMEKILGLLESDSVRIYLFDRKHKMIELVAHKGLSPVFVTEDRIKRRKVGDGFLGRTILTRKTTVVDNLEALDKPYAGLMLKEGLLSTAYVPLVSKGEPVGVMCVSSHVFKFSEDYVECLTGIGSQIGIAIDNANLYESIQRSYEELKEAQEQVIRAEKLASLGKLAASIAHEINNPLSVILNYIRLLTKLLRRGSFTAHRLGDISRYLNTMESETLRCGEIVKSLLTFSRQSKMTIKAHRLEDIIDKTLILIAHDLSLRGVQCVKETSGDLPPIECDFKQIQQVILNLMGNAAEAMEGGGTLTIKAKISEKAGFMEVAVSDTGEGIAGENLSSIFEPFFTTKAEGAGVGLGLSVAYGIVMRHNGFIEVESEPMKGSTFRVLLPIVQIPQEEFGRT